LYLLDGSSVFDLERIPSQENVIILSKHLLKKNLSIIFTIGKARELESIDGIMENELVRSFYEYGGKKDLKIYSKSHIRSRMASLMETEEEMEKKMKEVLTMLDAKKQQLDSEELERILTESNK